MPRGTPYWFESSGEEDLELLQMAGFEKNTKVERIDVEPQKFDPGAVPLIDAKN